MRQVKLYLVMVRYLPMLRMAMATLEPVVHTSQHFLYRYTYHIGVFFSYLPLLRMAMATLEPVAHTSQHILHRDQCYIPTCHC